MSRSDFCDVEHPDDPELKCILSGSHRSRSTQHRNLKDGEVIRWGPGDETWNDPRWTHAAS